MQRYDHQAIEQKWQDTWQANGLYNTQDVPGDKKCYVLDMFPYPSGEGLHVGHPKGYIATDIYARFKRMNGYSVLHPMGWDAFGLPAENYALKHKVHPRVAVEKNIATFKAQLAKIGFSYDWNREINTTDPAYYKWTQWIFLKLLEHGLAYESYEPINWCPSCKTGLANEDVDGGVCERCGTPVEQKPLRQWVLRITEYADQLLEDLEDLNWEPHIKELQRNWIGRKEGYEIDFALEGEGVVTVFTTRPDTLFGVSALVLAPEHPFVSDLQPRITNWHEVHQYIEVARNKTTLERTSQSAEKEKTGVMLEGVSAIHPATGEAVPLFVADYVLGGYGTGAVMVVPAHDDRDLLFSINKNLPIKPVVARVDPTTPGLREFMIVSSRESGVAVVEEGVLFNSGEFDGLKSTDAREAIATKVGGRKKITYRLNDWVFSRQRYWGEPIPVIHCGDCGVVPVPEEQLPVVLPEVESYEPTGTGESPLAAIEEWVHVSCPRCGGEAKRETNTMPQWAGSSWYYLRYIDPTNEHALVDEKKEKEWMPVDMYVGGAEHATRHLIYARFWHKFLHKIGVVSTSEPFTELKSVGLILAEDGRKMSKRWGNVINPDDIVERFGADSLRVYEMFMGPFEGATAWNTDGLVGVRRFIEKVVRISETVDESPASEDLTRLIHKTIKKVEESISRFSFNTAVSAMMICARGIEETGHITREQFELYLRVLAPYVPHISEELWSQLGNTASIHEAPWPVYDPALVVDETISIAVQVNGKVRATLECSAESSEAEITKQALAHEGVVKWLNGATPKKIIYVSGRLLSIVA